VSTLAQIEARLKRFKEQIDMAKQAATEQGAKTIGVLVAPEMYARLKRLADTRKISLKMALLTAAEEGLHKLGF
jgi:hypothetical protein